LSLAIALGIGVVASGLSTASDARAADDARGIMDKVAQTRKLDGSEAAVKMTITDADGKKRTRELTMASKVFDGGATEKRVYRFSGPADVKGMGILVFDYANKADDVWIFLPALRKVRRVVNSETSKSFMGSEFSYGDLNIPALDDYTYKLVKEENYGGEACYVIDVLPKNDAVKQGEGYSKKTYWISKAKYTALKGVYFDLAGKALKELKCADVALLDPAKKRYRAKRMEMTNLQNSRKSVFETSKVAFTPETKDEYFTERYLQRP
jgi:hypothetical protein